MIKKTHPSSFTRGFTLIEMLAVPAVAVGKRGRRQCREAFTLIEMLAVPAVAVGKRGRRQWREAFTLIEMLVVIAIIALLASIIIPAVNKAVGRARTASAMSNLRSIGNGIQLYSMDHNFKYPVRYHISEEVHGKSMHWQEQIQGYLGKDKGSVFDYQKNEVYYSKNADRIGGNHFGLNKFMFENQPRWSYRTDAMPSASQTVIIGEINQNTSAFDPEVTPAFDGKTETKWRISNPGNIGLYMFADYHVEGIKGVPDPDEYPNIWKWW